MSWLWRTFDEWFSYTLIGWDELIGLSRPLRLSQYYNPLALLFVNVAIRVVVCVREIPLRRSWN